jgi:hypothetical protein
MDQLLILLIVVALIFDGVDDYVNCGAHLLILPQIMIYLLIYC